MKIQIIKKGYGKTPGQVLDVCEFEGGHLTAFGFAVPYVEKRRETQVVVQPETRELDHEHVPIDEVPRSFFKRRGRRPNK